MIVSESNRYPTDSSYCLRQPNLSINYSRSGLTTLSLMYVFPSKAAARENRYSLCSIPWFWSHDICLTNLNFNLLYNYYTHILFIICIQNYASVIFQVQPIFITTSNHCLVLSLLVAVVTYSSRINFSFCTLVEFDGN